MARKIEPTLRTAKTQESYQQAMEDGTTKDISKLRGSHINRLKLLQNVYPYDTVYKDNDMLVDESGSFWEFWVRLGQLVYNEELPYDQLIMNMKHKQSQSHVEHVHLVRFKNRSDFTL